MESFLTIKLEVDIWIHLDTSPLRPLWLHSFPDSPGFGPGVASPVASPALAHLGLASQIYAWMAGAQVAGPLNDVKQLISKAIPHIPPCADSVRTFGSHKDVGTL